MKQYKLSDADQRQIAHYIAQKGISDIAPGQPQRATDRYITIFNDTLEQLKNYNEKATD